MMVILFSIRGELTAITDPVATGLQMVCNRRLP